MALAQRLGEAEAEMAHCDFGNLVGVLKDMRGCACRTAVYPRGRLVMLGWKLGSEIETEIRTNRTVSGTPGAMQLFRDY
ncbi:MAG TPA: hypothetical protein VHM93_25370 [Candidatus Acidoferrum sp.]|jgi:hypothetical protein|nr:hypothetical protein [Candidatus Acidoferrum sp.]